LDRTALYPNHRLAYFYFTEGGENINKTYQTALLALLRQAAYDPLDGSISKPVIYAFNEAGGDSDDQKPLRFVKSIYKSLLKGVLESGVSLRVIIDALDQCDEPEELLQIIYEVSQENPGKLEIFLSGRYRVNVASQFPKRFGADINRSMPKDDMVKYITTEVKDRPISRRLLEGKHEELENELIEILCNRAGKMYD
jgi:hypothetical protein